MTRYVIHNEACPALCRAVNCDKRHSYDHACSGSCPSPEALAELIEAAEIVVSQLNQAAVMAKLGWVFRLDAALRPFTKENQ